MSYGSGYDAKEQIRQKIDIVDLVGSYLELRRQGRMYVALCPWHNDSRPSLQVNPERQTWKCWVCDIGGDLFNFVMQRESCDFREALALLAERAGVPLTQHRQAPVQPGSPDDKATLYQCCAWAEQQFHDCLLHAESAAIAREYFADRQLSPESVARFRLGFSPNEWSWLVDRARRTQFSPAVLEAVGLAARSERTGGHYDRFKGRVIFPIRDLQGRPIAFGGRVLPGQADEHAAKYINSPETRLFSKSDQLYALDQARHAVAKSRQITVVEGYTDVIMCHQHGLDDVVAVLGTALGPRHIQLLKRFADTIHLVLDGDEAGQRRTNEILQLFIQCEVDLRICTLPDELDPCEFLLERPASEFRAQLAGAVDALTHHIRLQTRGLDIARDVHGAHRALEGVLRTIALAPRAVAGVSGSEKLREHQILTHLAREFALSSQVVAERMVEIRKTVKRASEPAGPTSDEPRVRLSQLSSAEVELLELLAQHPDLAPTALAEVADDDLPGEPARTIFRAYRQLEEAGDSLEFGRVLAEIESSPLKALLVQIDDRAAARGEKAMLDAATRLRCVIDFLNRRHQDVERRQAEAALAEGRLAAEDEKDLLNQILQKKRQQQGIVAPTDG